MVVTATHEFFILGELALQDRSNCIHSGQGSQKTNQYYPAINYGRRTSSLQIVRRSWKSTPSGSASVLDHPKTSDQAPNLKKSLLIFILIEQPHDTRLHERSDFLTDSLPVSALSLLTLPFVSERVEILVRHVILKKTSRHRSLHCIFSSLLSAYHPSLPLPYFCNNTFIYFLIKVNFYVLW